MPRGGEEDSNVQNLYGLFGGRLLYKYRFSRLFFLQLGLGGGITLNWRAFDYNGTPGLQQSSVDPWFDAVLTAQVFFRNRMYLALDLGLLYIVHNDTLAYGFVPGLRVGYQLF